MKEVEEIIQSVLQTHGPALGTAGREDLRKALEILRGQSLLQRPVGYLVPKFRPEDLEGFQEHSKGLLGNLEAAQVLAQIAAGREPTRVVEVLAVRLQRVAAYRGRVVVEAIEGDQRCTHPPGVTSCNWCGWRMPEGPPPPPEPVPPPLAEVDETQVKCWESRSEHNRGPYCSLLKGHGGGCNYGP